MQGDGAVHAGDGWCAGVCERGANISLRLAMYIVLRTARSCLSQRQRSSLWAKLSSSTPVPGELLSHGFGSSRESNQLEVIHSHHSPKKTPKYTHQTTIQTLAHVTHHTAWARAGTGTASLSRPQTPSSSRMCISTSRTAGKTGLSGGRTCRLNLPHINPKPTSHLPQTYFQPTLHLPYINPKPIL